MKLFEVSERFEKVLAQKSEPSLDRSSNETLDIIVRHSEEIQDSDKELSELWKAKLAIAKDLLSTIRNYVADEE